MDDRGKKLFFVGVSEGSYRLYDPVTKKVTCERNVEIDEKRLYRFEIVQQKSETESDVDYVVGRDLNRGPQKVNEPTVRMEIENEEEGPTEVRRSSRVRKRLPYLDVIR